MKLHYCGIYLEIYAIIYMWKSVCIYNFSNLCYKSFYLLLTQIQIRKSIHAVPFSCCRFGYIRLYLLYHKDVLKLENIIGKYTVSNENNLSIYQFVRPCIETCCNSPFLQVILSSSNTNPASQEHSCFSFLLLKIWLQPPFLVSSQGCTK